MRLNGSLWLFEAKSLMISHFPNMRQVYSLVNQEETQRVVTINSAQTTYTNNEERAFFSGQRNVSKFI